MPDKVGTPNEVSLFGMRFPVEGGVQPFLVNQSIPSIVIGEGDPTKEEKASKWYFTNCKGGHGKYKINMSGGDATDRIWDSDSDTATGEITLPPLATEITLPAALTAKPVDFGTSTYLFCGTAIRRINSSGVVQFYCTNDTVWESGTAGGAHPAQAAAASVVSAYVYNGYLFFSYTSNYGCYDGSTTWLANPTAARTSTYMTEWDNILINVDANGAVTKSNMAGGTEPYVAGATWAAVSNIRNGTPVGMGIWRDGVGDPTPIIFTNARPFVVDMPNSRVEPLKVRWTDLHADNGKAGEVWNGDLIYAKGGGLNRYSIEGQEADMGPGTKDDGLISTRVGRVVDSVTSLQNMLIIAIDAGSQTSSVMRHANGGWHTLIKADVANESIKYIHYSNATGTGRLYFSQGSSLWWIPLQDTTPNPRQVSGSTYGASSTYTTPWFGIGTMRSTALDFIFNLQGMSADETMAVAIGTNLNDTDWTTIGTISANGYQQLTISTTGLNYYYIRIRLTLGRGSTTTNTPRVLSGALRWLPAPYPLYGYSFRVNASNTHLSNTDLELEAKLEGITKGQVGVFSFRPDDDRYVKVEEMRSWKETGHASGKQYNITVIEQVAASTINYIKWGPNSTKPGKWDGTSKWK